MRGMFLDRSTDFDKIFFAQVAQTMTFHDDLPYTTKQFTTNLTDVTLTTWLL